EGESAIDVMTSAGRPVPTAANDSPPLVERSKCPVAVPTNTVELPEVVGPLASAVIAPMPLVPDAVVQVAPASSETETTPLSFPMATRPLAVKIKAVVRPLDATVDHVLPASTVRNRPLVTPAASTVFGSVGDTATSEVLCIALVAFVRAHDSPASAERYTPPNGAATYMTLLLLRAIATWLGICWSKPFTIS